jgi:very-short-patch-repair endonuclease
VHRDQLLAAGVGRGAISYRLKTGQLTSVYRDVYLIGHPPLRALQLAVAAVLHFRGTAVVSHVTAAALWGVVDPEAMPAEVTVVGREVHTRESLVVHRVSSLDPADVRRRHGIPVTAPPRTLVDLAACESQLVLENALAECRRRGLAREGEVRAALKRAGPRKGVGRLRALLDAGQAALTRSKAERLLLGLIRAAELPEPLANASVCGHMVDLLWPEQRLVVEFDGWDTHGRRDSFESDRRRDQRLAAAGYRVIRITWRQLEHEPYAVIARLAAALR